MFREAKSNRRVIDDPILAYSKSVGINSLQELQLNLNAGQKATEAAAIAKSTDEDNDVEIINECADAMVNAESITTNSTTDPAAEPPTATEATDPKTNPTTNPTAETTPDTTPATTIPPNIAATSDTPSKTTTKSTLSFSVDEMDVFANVDESVVIPKTGTGAPPPFPRIYLPEAPLGFLNGNNGKNTKQNKDDPT